MTGRESAAVDRVLSWVRDSALPLWHLKGWDHRHGGFIERFDADGAPERDAPRRMRVQARQVYVYAHAALLGWYEPAAVLALDGFSWLIERCWARDGRPGFVHLVEADGALADGRRDAYDQAFGLLALAWAYRLRPDAQVRALIGAELDYLDAAFADPVHGGWFESDPPALPRRQNPQMHAFEAMLALHEATGEAMFLDRARRFLDLLERRLYDPATGAVHEYFDASFRPLPGVEGRIAEPGHHFEWTWLLHAYARLCGEAVRPLAGPIYDWAERHGLDAGSFVMDEVRDDGAPHAASIRLWPHTEYVKANVVRHEAGICPRAAGNVEAMWARFLPRFAAVEPRGGWVDRFDAEGRLTDARRLASSFYHVFGAAAETARVLRPA